MSFDSSMYMAEEGLSEAIGSLVSLALSNVLSFGMIIFSYVFTALSLYTIAQRRGIKNPWMAWVPVLNYWILGSISDQYRYVVRGQVRNRRKVLLILEVLKVVGIIAAVVMAIVAGVQAIMGIPYMEMMSEEQIVLTVFKKFIPSLCALGVLIVATLILVVLTAIAYYDLFASCEPENKVLYLVLGLIFSITLPIFLFVCRKKDLGMPARKAAQPAQDLLPVEPAAPVQEEETVEAAETAEIPEEQ